MSNTRLIPAAIAYDFDGTLAPGNMQDREFIPNLGMKPKEFWALVKSHAKEHDMDEILAYMDLMLREARRRDVQVSLAAIADSARRIGFFPGVTGWFGRINRYAKNAGIALDHYIISSGLREMIHATKIAREFRYIFASGFRYDQHHVAEWPALAVNFTNKAQFLFRINKGIINSYDNSTINRFMEEADRPVPFRNIIYLGDGETDIPAMKMVTHQGGRAIAVYSARRRNAKRNAVRLVTENRANAAVPADYRKGLPLERAVRATLDEISARHAFDRVRKEIGS